MTPLTPEQVEKLRLPEGYQLGLEAVRSRGWYVDFPEDRAHQSARNNELANFACAIANGHLPPEALDAVWAVVEGRVERITVGSADYYGGPQDVRTIEPEPVDELVTHLLIQVKP